MKLMERSLNQNRAGYMQEDKDPVYFIWTAMGAYLQMWKVKPINLKAVFAQKVENLLLEALNISSI